MGSWVTMAIWRRTGTEKSRTLILQNGRLAVDGPKDAVLAHLALQLLHDLGPGVIVAELIGSSSGIGHMITDSQALLNTGQIIFGIIVIGVIGLISDFLFKWANQRLFPWSLA